MVGLNRVMMYLAAQSVKSFNQVASQFQAIPKAQMEQLILEMNAPEMPFEITKDKDVIKIKWKLADAQWFKYLAGVGVKERYELHILLTNQGEARVIETRKSLRAELGITGGGVQTKSFRGWQFFAIEYKKVYGVTQIFPPRAGEAMNMQYNAASFRGPFLKLLSDNGWKIKPVTLSLKWGL